MMTKSRNSAYESVLPGAVDHAEAIPKEQRTGDTKFYENQTIGT